MITLAKLKLQDGKFWRRLLWVINISHYFSKLGWGFEEELKTYVGGWGTSMNLTLIGIEAISTDDLAEISRTLIKNIFRLPPGYRRFARSPLPAREIISEVSYISLQQISYPSAELPPPRPSRNQPRYPGYPEVELVRNATKPLTDEDIELEDLKMFQHKLYVAWEDNWKELVKEKLTTWRELINTRNS